jgi:hypothetical protein
LNKRGKQKQNNTVYIGAGCGGGGEDRYKDRQSNDLGILIEMLRKEMLINKDRCAERL